MALPNLPPTNVWEEQSDAAKKLAKETADVGRAMANMGKNDAPLLVAQLQKIAQNADKAGPILSKLFKMDPQAARSLRSQFQSIIDGAAEMAAKVQQKAQEAEAAAAKASKDKHDSTLRGAARGIRNLPTGGVGGAAVGALALAGPEGEVAAAAFSAITQAISQATDAVSQYAAAAVQAANPGVWDRYERSVQDLSSVFGQAFTPAVQLATEYTDKLNGVLTEIAPILSEIVQELTNDFRPVLEATVSLGETLAEAFKSAWAENGEGFKSFLRELAEEMATVIKIAQRFITVLGILDEQQRKTGKTDIVSASAEATRRIAEADKAAKEAANKKTFAARPAEFTGIEDIGKKVALAAASAGEKGSSVEDPGQTIADAAAATVAKMEETIAGMAELVRVGNNIVAVVSPLAQAKAAADSPYAARAIQVLDNASGAGIARGALFAGLRKLGGG
jgi:hypothetical protein